MNIKEINADNVMNPTTTFQSDSALAEGRKRLMTIPATIIPAADVTSPIVPAKTILAS